VLQTLAFGLISVLFSQISTPHCEGVLISAFLSLELPFPLLPSHCFVTVVVFWVFLGSGWGVFVFVLGFFWCGVFFKISFSFG